MGCYESRVPSRIFGDTEKSQFHYYSDSSNKDFEVRNSEIIMKNLKKQDNAVKEFEKINCNSSNLQSIPLIPLTNISKYDVNLSENDYRGQIQRNGSRSFSDIASPDHRFFGLKPSDLVFKKNVSAYSEYTVEKVLGTGAFSTVYQVFHKTTLKKRALKCIKKKIGNSNESNVLREVSILKSLDHPNMVKIIEFYEIELEYQIVTDLCTGGELFDKITDMKYFSEPAACKIMHQILSCLNYCHSHNIVHRDIKPENLLFENSSPDSIIKLIDFGTSKFYNSIEKMTLKEGTTEYMAPEVFEANYDEKCDIWSCGVVLYVLLSGCFPFDGDNDREIIQKILCSDVQFPSIWFNITVEAKKFILKLLNKNPKVRYNALEALNDPWMQKLRPKEYNNADFSPNMKINLKNLEGFNVQRDFHYLIMMIMVQYLISNEEQQPIRKLFQSLDSNADGMISEQELIIGLEKLEKNPEIAAKKAKKIMKFMDKNNTNHIEYSEFLLGSINQDQFFSDKKLEMAFKLIDKNDNGIVTLDDLKALFGNVETQTNINFWNELFQKFTKDGQNYMDLNDFKNWMLECIKKKN